MSEPLVAGMELGGTKCIAVLASGRDILARERLPTRQPAETLPALVDCITGWREAGAKIAALGLASFGPLALDPEAPDYGRLTSTPKAGWADTDLVGAFTSLGMPIALDTDVNAAALAEGRWGAARGARVHAYLTIGTGIGGGAVVDGKPVHGLMHPEMGHVRIQRRSGDTFPGICPYHGDCLEGLASGPAIAARAGRDAGSLLDDHPLWADIGAEIGELAMMLLLILSPERILIGGGVGSRPVLLDHVRRTVDQRLNGYLRPCTTSRIAEIIRNPQLGDDTGPLGAIALAQAKLAGRIG